GGRKRLDQHLFDEPRVASVVFDQHQAQGCCSLGCRIGVRAGGGHGGRMDCNQRRRPRKLLAATSARRLSVPPCGSREAAQDRDSLTEAPPGVETIEDSQAGGGAPFRRLLPVAVIVPLVLGGIRAGLQEAGVLDLWSGTGLIVLAFIGLGVWFILY